MSSLKIFPILILCVLLAACSSQSASTEAAPSIQTEAPPIQTEAPTTQTDTPTTQAPAPAAGVSYASDIQPIFNASCAGCHGGSGGLSLENYDQLMAGGNSGTIIITGNPDESLLTKRLTGEIAPKMPRGGSLTEEQIGLIRQWIEEGALNN